MPDWGLSEIGSAAAESGATAAETGAATTLGTEGALTSASGVGAGIDPFAAGVGAGVAPEVAGTGAGVAGVTATPGLLDTVTGAYKAVSPYGDTAGKVLNMANTLKNAISGSQGQPMAPGQPSPAPLATAPTMPTTTPGTKEDYLNQEQAYWQQLFAGSGQGLPGNQLPPDIQAMIQRNAAQVYPS